jgi:hypothetical protein
VTASTIYTQTADIFALSSSQLNTINSLGWTMTVNARVSNGVGTGYPYPDMDDTVNVGTRRYDFVLSLDGSGNTVASLATSLSGGYNFYTTGPAYTTSGSGYHLYQLVCSPDTGLADLYIDGVDRIAGYAGQTQFYSHGTGSAAFTINNGGVTNTSYFALDVGNTVPEPSSLVILGGAVLASATYSLKRRRRHHLAPPRRFLSR